jgi:hypothetical protein
MYFVCKMNWSFFGIRHKKGEWDGALMKRALKMEYRNIYKRLQNAQDCVDFLISTMSTRTLNSYDTLW